MFNKIGSSPDINLKTITKESVFADPAVVARFTKLAKNIKSIAPKSDDFLYFSIIFLKAAESAILDDDGSIKKVAGGEDAWGFFDENWRWHGNVLPHKNKNSDIFPESELKIAAAKWIGLPLCRDHESSSVDGVRGIILDTHYDEKFKQVVGLCALDKVSYPDLAAKVQNGLIRYGSMGTAVETSICTECGNKAATQKDYCQHIISRAAHGEINVGLKPIEYSLVVQPAEPGAILLRCMASLKEYKEEFMNYGVEDFDSMVGKLNAPQAQHLEQIMKSACGENGCSIPQRRNIVTAFLQNNGLVKKAEIIGETEKTRNIAESASALGDVAELLTDPKVPDSIKGVLGKLVKQLDGQLSSGTRGGPKEESFTSDESRVGNKGSGDVRSYSGATQGGGNEGSNILGSGQTEPTEGFPDRTEGDILGFNPSGGPSTSFASDKSKTIKTSSDNFNLDDIVEEIMNDSRLKKRAELRRRVAYMQGGSEGKAEPATYKSEKFPWDKDKQMHQTGKMGGDDGMFPGDEQTKEKLSRAELEDRRIKRLAYMQGGSEGKAEPATYKSEKFPWDKDKQMHQGGKMGGDKGMFPGDQEAKKKVSRAAYVGPALSTRFSVKKASNGAIDKKNSVLEVFSGDKRVIVATAGEIFGNELAENWDWLKSREYGQEICKQVRASGVASVRGILKNAQEAPPVAPPAPPAPMPEMPAMPEMSEDKGDEPKDSGEPAEQIDSSIAQIETLLEEVKTLVKKLSGKSGGVDIDIFTGEDGDKVDAEGGELGALSSVVIRNLKKAYRKLDQSADELSMVAETYENISKLSRSQRTEFVKLANSAVKDADITTGEAKALISIASSWPDDDLEDDGADYDSDENDLSPAAREFWNESEYSGHDDEDENYEEDEDDAPLQLTGPTDADADDVSDLVAAAMELRKGRREAILKQSEDRILSDRRSAREALLKTAQDADLDADADDDSADADASCDTSYADAEDEHLENDLMEDEHMDADALDMSADESASVTAGVKSELTAKFAQKKADDEREFYKLKLRRAYDIGLDMQRKGLLPTTKTALDRQVDEVMNFDDRAFEAFKRSIANAKPISTMKIASDLGGINVGVESDSNTGVDNTMKAGTLSTLWG